MAIEYITMREVADKSGEVKGKIKIMKLKEESDASLDITCPGCGKNDKRKEAWAEPFVKGVKNKRVFTVNCKNCGFTAKLLNLKKEVKRKQKK